MAEESGDEPEACLKKASALNRITLELVSKAAFDEKMRNVSKHLRDFLDSPSTGVAWIEVDGETYGEPAMEGWAAYSARINVQGRSRGAVCAGYPGDGRLSGEEEAWLRETADIVGRQVEVHDDERALRLSEERYRKLAGNLDREMWSRTEALAKETGYLEGILRSSDDMIITTDLESRVVEFNHGAEEILGYTAEEIQGREITEIWEDAEERNRILDQVTATGSVRNYETRLKTKSGEGREISLTLSLLKDDEGRTLGTVGVSKDITREKAIRRQLERLNKNYRETIHFISHESKNSFVVISGFVRRLMETETVPARKEELRIVYHHSQFLEAMSRDYLVMAELERGEFRVRKRPIGNFYKEVIHPAMVGLKERYPDSFTSYDTSMGGVRDIQLTGDSGLLEIVYRNLFGNALKYRSPRGMISYGVEEQPDSYLFNVWNEGPGVPADQVETIFEKFYRVPNDTTRKKKGTGLGLYNIRRIIEAHGGRIWCETGSGEWINFLFELPKE